MSTKCYVAWSRDPVVLRRSTSGGMFSELAKWMLNKGGIVVGAAYGAHLRVEHRVARTEEELLPLCGVKYVQGTIGREVYDCIRKTLSERQKVLFTGLPCQCAAVRKMFEDDDNLYLCDLICYGAPSPRFWDRYITDLETTKHKTLKGLSPRDKRGGWGHGSVYRYDWSDGTVTRKGAGFDPYALAFGKNLSFRKCCFSCRFRGLERPVDFTIGDAWGIGEMGLHLPENVLFNGVSALMCHSPRVQCALKELYVDYREVDASDLLRKNPAIVHSQIMPEEWGAFQNDIQSLDFKSLIRKYGLRRSKTKETLKVAYNKGKRVLRRICQMCAFNAKPMQRDDIADASNHKAGEKQK